MILSLICCMLIFYALHPVATCSSPLFSKVRRNIEVSNAPLRLVCNPSLTSSHDLDYAT